MNRSLFRVPSAFVPPAMSLVALTMVIAHFALYGVDQAADEGTLAHVFQILLAAQVPIVTFFAFRWLPDRPRQAATVLVLQGVVWLAAAASVYWLT